MAIIYLLTRIKRRFIFFYLFRFRVLYRQTGSPGPVRLGFPSLTGGTPHCAKNFTLRFRQTPPVGQKKQDDTRQSSNGPRTRTPPTPVITAWKANLFLLLSLPVCSAVR